MALRHTAGTLVATGILAIGLVGTLTAAPATSLAVSSSIDPDIEVFIDTDIETNVSSAVTHYIVLFDGSGSVRNQHTERKDFWQGDFSAPAMAVKVRRFVSKALAEMPEAFGRYRPDVDLVSFALFNSDIYNPAYGPGQLFLTNPALLLHSDGLPPARDFETFDASVRTGNPGAEIALPEVFRGHSPLIAATDVSLPFLAEAIRDANMPHGRFAQAVDRIVLIRITDGQYNSESNGADERAVIARNAESERKKGGKTTSNADDGFDDHQARARAVARLFEIGRLRTDCALPTNNLNNPLAQDFDCAAGAYRQVAGWGLGFLISYFSVEPRVPGLGGLARTESTTVPLSTVWRDGELRLTGHNAIFTARFDDPTGAYSLVPRSLSWSTDANAWQRCVPPSEQGGAMDCGTGGPLLDFPEGVHPEALRYWAGFELQFQEQLGRTLLYPFRFNLPALDLPPVGLTVAPLNAIVYDLPRDPDDLTLQWLNPQRLQPGSAPVIPEVLLTPALFAQHARAWSNELAQRMPAWQRDWELPDGETVLPRMIELISQQKKAGVLMQEADLANGARWFWGGLLVLGALLWLLLPRRRLGAALDNFAANGLVIDFNNREHERPLLAGMLTLTNTRNKPLNTGTSLLRRVRATLALQAVPGSDGLKLADRQGAPLALGSPHQADITDSKVASGRQVPVLFDPTEIGDVKRPVGPGAESFDVAAIIEITAEGAGPTRQEQIAIPVTILPEQGRLEITADPALEILPDGNQCYDLEWQRNANRVPLRTYAIRNAATHRYSLPVQGDLQVRVRPVNGTADEGSIAGALSLVEGECRAARLDYYLRHGDPAITVSLVADFTHITNPIASNEYEVTLLRRGTTDGQTVADVAEELDGPVLQSEDGTPAEVQPWVNHEQWFLRIKRSSERTDVSVMLLEHERHYSQALNADRLTLVRPFVVATPDRPNALRPHPQQAQNKSELVKIRLTNTCQNGHGYADWHAELVPVAIQGLRFPSAALRLTDANGNTCISGRLSDSHLKAERETELAVELALGEVEFDERDSTVTLALTVHWNVYEDGDPNTDNVRRFSNQARIHCHLRHEPPRHVLAIDFGTSALAIAYANRLEDMDLLPLSRRLTEIEAETKPPRTRRKDDPTKANQAFLASEFNICPEPARLAATRPRDPGFLDLPLIEDAVYQQPDLCFSSLKALISAGFTELPLDPGNYPYLNAQGEPERNRAPPLDDVIHGAYAGLKANYIDPLLARSRVGYSHICITYPNTYMRNHVDRLRRIVENVFRGVADGLDRVYPDNIRFFSESDAVAYYYMIYAHDLRKGPPPLKERILVYDIGAGTLDLTHLEVSWEKHGDGCYSPTKVKVRRRGGVAKAGDLLDECIARDLHGYLASELDAKTYLTPLVVPAVGEIMPEQMIRRMDVLRQQIHGLKSRLGDPNAKPSLELSQGGLGVQPLVLTEGDDTPKHYTHCTQLRATARGQVFWEPDRERLLGGPCVSGFVEQVTHIELLRFFNNQVPPLDTVILSGRTSLWPGFRDRLLNTLGQADLLLVDFGRDADLLKQVVVQGVLEHEFRWRSVTFVEPETVGEFGVRYEQRAKEWRFVPYPESGQEMSFDLHTAAEVQIGLKTNNGFQTCFSFFPDEHCSEDHKLHIRLDFDATGFLKARVRNTRGENKLYTDHTSAAVLDYKRRPWPLGAARLHETTLAELLGANDAEVRS